MQTLINNNDSSQIVVVIQATKITVEIR